MTAPITLTAKQVEFLSGCVEAACSPWSVGSTTISTLKKAGFIHRITVDGWTRYIATDAGRAWLAANGGTNGRE